MGARTFCWKGYEMQQNCWTCPLPFLPKLQVHNSYELDHWRAIKFIITAVHPSLPGRPFHIPETHPCLQVNPFIKLSDSSSVTGPLILSSTNNLLHIFSKQSDFSFKPSNLIFTGTYLQASALFFPGWYWLCLSPANSLWQAKIIFYKANTLVADQYQ